MTPILASRGGVSARAFGMFGATAIDNGQYQSIQTFTVGAGGSATISFTSIPSTYKHLQIRGMSIGTTGSQDVLMYFNGVNTANNYAWHEIRGDGATASARGTANTAFMYVAANSTDPTYPTAFVIDILDYANTSKNKTARVLSGGDRNGSGTVSLFSGLALTTSAISSITIYTPGAYSLNQNSSIALYGIKG